MGRFTERRRFALIVLALAVLTFAGYGRVCNDYFVSDDPEFIIRAHAAVGNPRILLDFFASSGLDPRPLYRPLQYVVLSLTYLFAGPRPFLFHLVNILIHLLDACLIYCLVALLLTPDGRERALPAFLAAALFAVHPVHHEPVIWINTVTYPLVVFFYLSCLVFAVRHDRGAGRRYLYFSLASFVCALATAESSISIPAVVLLYHLLWKSRRKDRWPQRLARIVIPVLPYLCVLGGYFLFRKLIFGTTAIRLEGYFTKIYMREYLLSDFTRFFNPLSNPRHYYLYGALRWALLSLALILLGFIISIVKRRGGLPRLILFGSLWFLLCLGALYRNFGFAMFPPRFFYLPSIGLCIAAGGSMEALLSPLRAALPGRIAYAACAALVILLCLLGLWSYVDDWAECAEISLRIKEQMDDAFATLGPDERFVLLNTQYNVWAAWVYNRNGPRFFMEPPLHPARCGARVLPLNMRQFPDDITQLREAFSSEGGARYYCWCEPSRGLVEIPREFVAGVIEKGGLDSQGMVERYCD